MELLEPILTWMYVTFSKIVYLYQTYLIFQIVWYSVILGIVVSAINFLITKFRR